jgi:ribosomal protein S18 acetylase RimI-like enzyme
VIALPAGYRWAIPEDAAAMAELVNMAGEGMPHYLWRQSAELGESPWDVGRRRARRESGSYSYRNTVVREDHGKAVAILIGYPLPDVPAPVDWNALSPLVVPLQELEDRASGTWYVNILATYPGNRGKGYGAALLGVADHLAAATQRRGLSLIVGDANTGARRLYERHGFRELETRPMIKDDWHNEGHNWVLLVKGTDGSSNP